jgi:hypothetical protein
MLRIRTPQKPRQAKHQGKLDNSGLAGREANDGLSSTFAKACREADAKQSRKPVDPRIARARRLLDDDVSLERAWSEVNSSHDVPLATIEAAEFLIRQGKPAELRAWLARRTTHECEAILQCLERRKRARVK